MSALTSSAIRSRGVNPYAPSITSTALPASRKLRSAALDRKSPKSTTSIAANAAPAATAVVQSKTISASKPSSPIGAEGLDLLFHVMSDKISTGDRVLDKISVGDRVLHRNCDRGWNKPLEKTRLPRRIVYLMPLDVPGYVYERTCPRKTVIHSRNEKRPKRAKQTLHAEKNEGDDSESDDAAAAADRLACMSASASASGSSSASSSSSTSFSAPRSAPRSPGRGVGGAGSAYVPPLSQPSEPWAKKRAASPDREMDSPPYNPFKKARRAAKKPDAPDDHDHDHAVNVPAGADPADLAVVAAAKPPKRKPGRPGKAAPAVAAAALASSVRPPTSGGSAMAASVTAGGGGSGDEWKSAKPQRPVHEKAARTWLLGKVKVPPELAHVVVNVASVDAFLSSIGMSSIYDSNAADEADLDEKKTSAPTSAPAPAPAPAPTTAAAAGAGVGAGGYKKKKRVRITAQSRQKMFEWLCTPEHMRNPYPSTSDIPALAVACSLPPEAVKNWFINHRERVVKPFWHHHYLQSTSGQPTGNQNGSNHPLHTGGAASTTAAASAAAAAAGGAGSNAGPFCSPIATFTAGYHYVAPPSRPAAPLVQ